MTLTHDASGGPEKGRPLDESSMQLRVLIVDDMRSMRAHTRSMLGDQGYLIAEAANGLEAIEQVKRFRPHIVLMDISMPEMDGITCCRTLRANADFRDIKVIMATGREDYEHVSEAFQAGCDDYVTKPINRDELRGKVGELGKAVLCRQYLRTLLKKKPSRKR
jgi:PleD family two-component response regulator